MRKHAATVGLIGTFSLALAALGARAHAAMDVVPVPWNALDPTIPHQAYNGHPTTFKAIGRGGPGPYLVEWDFDGDGTYDMSFTATDRYNFATVYTYPDQAATITFTARVRATNAIGEVDTGEYPVRVFADVPLDPTGATDRQRQIMRGVAVDDALWWMHLNVVGRSGDETNPFTGAQITGYFNHGNGSYVTASASSFIWAMSLNGHFVAFPPGAYIGTFPSAEAEAESDFRWTHDPYAEDVLRNLNWLLANRIVVVGGIPAVDESNAYGMYPEITRTPIPGSDDGIGLFMGYGGADMTTYPMGHALSALAVARLAGFAAQVGDPTYVMGKPFELIIQQMVDALVWSQIDGGCADGGWYYTPNPPNSCDYMDSSTNLWAVTGLWHADEFMSDDGIIVNNRAKYRMANNFINNAYGLTGNEYCARYRTSNVGCDFTLTAGPLLVGGWLGIDQFNASDPVLAFPGYSGHSRATLRQYYDRYLNMVNTRWLTFQESGVNTTWTSGLWEIGSSGLADFERTDRLGNTYAMLHMQDAARAHKPEIISYGSNDWLQQFTIYLVQNQYPDGHFQSNWCNNPSPGICAYSDAYYGTSFLSTGWSALILTPDAIPPLAIATATLTSTAEGTVITFDGSQSDPGTGNPTWVWDFDNGDTAAGQVVDYAFPDNGTFTVTFTASSIGGVSTDTIVVTISNVAPTIDAGANFSVDEGTATTFAPDLTDPGSADTHTYAWDFDDGSTSTDSNPTYAWSDNGTYDVVVVVTDDDGDSGNDLVTVTVTNVAPTITSTPGTNATEGSSYSYTMTFTDPGSLDTHTCSLPAAPTGMTITGCTVDWTPDFAQALGATADVTMCVTDDDGGATCQSWEISVSFIDTDGDGLPDSWETFYFGDLSQGAFDDPDGDGLVNLEEFNGVTDPTVYDGPNAPTPSSPTCGSEINVLAPTLTVANATDPQSTPLQYEFELYADVFLTSLVRAATMADGTAIPEGSGGTTSWDPGAALTENATYYWRSRAWDGDVFGSWSSVCSFMVNTVNEAPSAPGLSFPAIGGQVATLTPGFVLTASTDPEFDPLTYTYEVYGDADLTPPAIASITGEDLTWTSTATLIEDTWYWWRARATDDLGLNGPWSVTGRFFVSALNAPPEEPSILAPENGTVVNSLTATYVILNADDPDLDALVYDFELAEDDTFATPIDSATDVLEQGQQNTVWAPQGTTLEENGKYCWRVRADDGTATSAWVHACFVVSAVNDPPSVPTLMNPSDTSVAQTQRPPLSWVESSDPEGDGILYDVQISTTAEFAALVDEATGVAGNSTVLDTDLAEDQTYYWRARAVDEHGEASAFSTPNSFVVRLPAGGAPGLVGGGCDCRAGGQGRGVGGALGLLLLAGLALAWRRR